MTDERDFVRELGGVPEMPGDLYVRIDRKIRRGAVAARSLLACAALFIVALGSAGVLLVHKNSAPDVPSDVVAELRTVNGYITCADLDEQSASYAFDEGEIQE